jgi:hypothetical protein
MLRRAEMIREHQHMRKISAIHLVKAALDGTPMRVRTGLKPGDGEANIFFFLRNIPLICTIVMPQASD